MKILLKIILVVIFFKPLLIHPQPVENKKSEFSEIEDAWLKQLKNLQPEKTSEIPKEQESKTSIFGEAPSFVSIFSRFVFTLLFFGIFLYFLIQYFKKKNWIVNQNLSPIKILGSIPLMSGKYLQIIDIYGQIVILGISENNINVVQIVENSRISEKLRLWYEENQKRNQQSQWNISDFLQKVFGNSFSFWHQKIKTQRNFYTELKERNHDEIYLEDLEELLQFQKNKLKKFHKQYE